MTGIKRLIYHLREDNHMNMRKFRDELLYYCLDKCPEKYKKGLFLVGEPRKILSEIYFTMSFRLDNRIKVDEKLYV